MIFSFNRRLVVDSVSFLYYSEVIMQTKIAIGLLTLGLSWAHLSADVSEMIFYPQADFSEGIFHFNYQGAKNKNYGFMFDRGFDSNRIVYVRPEEHSIEKLKDGSVKLSFANTDRYSYVQRAYKDDFLVSEENGVYKILLRSEEHSIEKLKDGSVKLSFANTDRYSYVQRAYKDDFLVSEENGVYKILL